MMTMTTRRRMRLSSTTSKRTFIDGKSFLALLCLVLYTRIGSTHTHTDHSIFQTPPRAYVATYNVTPLEYRVLCETLRIFDFIRASYITYKY